MNHTIDELIDLWAHEFWDRRNYDIADTILADDFVRRGPSGEYVGREHYKQFLRDQHLSFPDYHHEIVDRSVDHQRGKALLLFHCTGTFTGTPYGGFAPTGKRMDLHAMDLLTVRDGRIVSNHGMYDRLGLYKSLGVL